MEAVTCWAVSAPFQPCSSVQMPESTAATLVYLGALAEGLTVTHRAPRPSPTQECQPMLSSRAHTASDSSVTPLSQMPSHFQILSSKNTVNNHITAWKQGSSLRNRISELGMSPKSYFGKIATKCRHILDLLGKWPCGQVSVLTPLTKKERPPSFLYVFKQSLRFHPGS